MMSCYDCVEVANGSSPNSERREPSDLHYNEKILEEICCNVYLTTYCQCLCFFFVFFDTLITLVRP